MSNSTGNSSGKNSDNDKDTLTKNEAEKPVSFALFEKIMALLNPDSSKDYLLAGLESVHKNDDLFTSIEVVRDYETPYVLKA